MKTAIPARTKIYGLDYLRAIACIFVVAFHASPILMDFWYARALHVFVFAAAVPVFILISLFLTESKVERKNYTLKKSYRLGKIYLLWGWLIPLILFAVTKLTSVSTEEFIDIINQRSIYQLIINGANWTYKVHGIYFLVFLIILSWIYKMIRPYMQSYSQMRQLFFGFGLINLLLPFLPQSYHVIRESFVPFLIYLPLAKMMHFDYIKGIDYKSRAIKWAVLYFITAIIEAGIIVMSNRVEFITYNYSPYGRLSIVFFAICIMYFSFTINRELFTQSKFFDIVSSCSLGIYLIHGFLIDYLQNSELNYSPLMLFSTVFSIALVLSAIIKDLPGVKQVLTL